MGLVLSSHSEKSVARCSYHYGAILSLGNAADKRDDRLSGRVEELYVLKSVIAVGLHSSLRTYI